jgi:curved DNA-binding protein CbpA
MSVQMSDFGQKQKLTTTYFEREKVGKTEILVEKTKNHDLRNATPEEKLKYGANGLPFYYLKKDKNGKVITSKMGVKITLSGDYKNLLNLKDVQELVEKGYEPLKALNMLLQSEKWREEHEDALTIVGYRIPTQGPNSMDIMIIHEFLPEYMGNTIILPAGITTKSGADYDIDKLSLFFKHITKEGKVVGKLNASQKQNYIENLADARKKLNLIKEEIQKVIAAQKENSKVKNEKLLDSGLVASGEVSETEEEMEELLEKQADLLVQYENELKNQENTHKELTDAYKEILNTISIYVKMLDKNAQFQNALMDSFESILTNPTMFYHMIKPNSTDTLEPLSIEIGNLLGRKTTKFEGSDVIKYLSSLNKHDELQEGKQLLGGWATSNKFLQNLILSNIKLRSSYKIITFNKDNEKKEKTVYVRNPLLTIEEEKKMLDKDGNYQLAGVFSADGKFAQGIFSEAINMTVDIESKPFARTLGLNKHNAQVAIYLSLKGVPQDRVWYFLNQPILLELYKDLNVTNNLKQSLANIVNKHYRPSDKKINSKGITSWLQEIVNNAEYNGHDIKLDIKSLKENLGKKDVSAVEKTEAGEFYDLLKVERNASSEEIKKAYRKVSMEVHPDKNQGSKESEDLFKKVNEAYETLSDPDKRKEYNAKTETKRITGTNNYFSENGDSSSMKQQMLVLAYFSTAGLEAAELQDMRRSSSFDSNKINGVLEAGKYLDTIEEIKKYSKLIVNPEDYYKHSLSMLWDELKVVNSVNKKIFPIASDDFISSMFAEPRYEPYKKGFTAVDKMKAERIILNDLMSALIQNFGLNEITEQGNLTPNSITVLDNKKGIWGIDTYDAEKEVYNLVNVETLEETTAKREQITSLNRYSFSDTLYDDINDYKEKTEDYDLIYDRLRDLKEKYPDLEEEYPVIKRLLSNVSKDGKISNIELYRADANETSDKNSYIDQFNQLVNYESDDFEKAAEVKDVFKTLMLVGFYQSGYNMSHIYFTDVISLDSMLPKILSANNVFNKINKADPEFAQEMLFAIAELIRYNNPRIYTYDTDENTGEIIEPFNRNYWRYKNFKLNLDDIVNSYVERKTGEVIPTAPTEPSTTEAPGLSQPSAPVSTDAKDGIEDSTDSDNSEDLDSSNSSTENNNDLDSKTPNEPEVKEVPTYEKFVSLLNEQGIITTINKEEFDNLSEEEQQRLIDDTKNCEF